MLHGFFKFPYCSSRVNTTMTKELHTGNQSAIANSKRQTSNLILPAYLFLFLVLIGCQSSKTEQRTDELYSRHLQRKITITVIHTPIPKDKSGLNLLILNDGQDIAAMGIKQMVDSLFKAGSIKPLVVVAVPAGDRMQEYGVAGKPDFQKRGNKADHYNSFIDDELYPFIKKQAGVQKFRTVAMAGWSLGGLSAFDIAWNNTGKIDKAGIFSGSFWWRDKDSNDSTYSDDKNRIVLSKIKMARRKGSQEFWFYAGGAEETSDRDGDGTIDVIDDTKDTRDLLLQRSLITESGSPLVIDPVGKHDIETWKKHFPDFLVWAFGK